jgi:hypothetical protein
MRLDVGELAFVNALLLQDLILPVLVHAIEQIEKRQEFCVLIATQSAYIELELPLLRFGQGLNEVEELIFNGFGH